MQNPQKILSPYIKEGITVLDMGCGPGFFTVEIAKMIGPEGKVLAADLQEGMLQKLKNKINGTYLEDRIKLIQCEKNKINVTDKVDFVLAFFVIHEIPDKKSLFKKLKEILNDEGQILIVEPKYFHVSQKAFGSTLKIVEDAGLRFYQGPKLPITQTAILKHA